MQKISGLLRKITVFVLLAGLISCERRGEEKITAAAGDWAHYLGDPGRRHYSLLEQINKENISKLEVAWVYNTGDFGENQCNPLVINGILYGTTAACEAFALDAATGIEKWRFVPAAEKRFLKSRGLSYWENGQDQRVLVTYDEWLYALDARTGLPVMSFGNKGRVSLKTGLGEQAKDKYVMSRTPGTVYENLIIMPLVVTRVPGHIQAFNIETGALEWVFHTIPQAGEYAYDTWPEASHESELVGGANCWAGMSVDKARGIVYVPTGSPHSPSDFWGGNRKGENLFGNSLIALNARTGKRLWHYQIVRHDILDRDLPSPPGLATINIKGRKTDVVVQITKTGQVFVFERETGRPVFPIEEKPFPASELEGEHAWPTQPVTRVPKPFSRQTLTIGDINPYSPDKDSLADLFRSSKSGMYTPLSETPTIVFPGYDGGGEWGGIGISPDGIMYVNSNEMAWISTLSPVAEQTRPVNQVKAIPGKQTYMNLCSMCHGADHSGNPASGFPSLKGIEKDGDKNVVADIITKGQGMMPGFPDLSPDEKNALIGYLFQEETEMVRVPVTKMQAPDIPWRFDGFRKFLDSEGQPGISPPWGQLTAIDLNTGNHLWQIVLGEDPLMKSRGIDHTGTENYGGPLITATGLRFIAATKDDKFRAFDKKDGRLLWEVSLPASAFATPSTYEANGRQFIVIACGGTKLGTERGDAFVAFALPE